MSNEFCCLVLVLHEQPKLISECCLPWLRVNRCTETTVSIRICTCISADLASPFLVQTQVPEEQEPDIAVISMDVKSIQVLSVVRWQNIKYVQAHFLDRNGDKLTHEESVFVAVTDLQRWCERGRRGARAVFVSLDLCR